MKSTQIVGLFVCVILALSVGAALADDDSWFVIKDRDSACKVIKAKDKTADTIAGPFLRKEQADEALEKACPKTTLEKLKDKAAEGIEKAKVEAEKLKEKAGPGIDKAKDAAEKLKLKAEEEIEKAKEKIRERFPEKQN